MTEEAGRPWGKANRKSPEKTDLTEPQRWQGEWLIRISRGIECWQHGKCWKEGRRAINISLGQTGRGGARAEALAGGRRRCGGPDGEDKGGTEHARSWSLIVLSPVGRGL